MIQFIVIPNFSEAVDDAARQRRVARLYTAGKRLKKAGTRTSGPVGRLQQAKDDESFMRGHRMTTMANSFATSHSGGAESRKIDRADRKHRRAFHKMAQKDLAAEKARAKRSGSN